MKPFAITIAFLLYTGLSSAQQRLSRYFDTVIHLQQFNGDILLAEQGKIVLKRTAGFADAATGRLNSARARFNLASISKLFTSTAILQLRDKGKLSLDDRVDRYLSGFPFPAITIRHLLTHTSGLPDLELFEQLVKQYPDSVMTNKNILPELQRWQRGLQFKPGEQYAYCNTGYSLLAMIVEKVSHMDYAAYVEKYILRPAGMTDSYISSYPGHDSRRDVRCVKMHVKPHPYYDSTYRNVDSVSRYRYTNYNCSGLTGGANIITTTIDLNRFDLAFFSGRLLRPGAVEEALTPAKLNNGQSWYGPMDTMLGEGRMTVGLGWEIFLMPGYGKCVGHGGFDFGLATFYFHRMDYDQVLIAYDNTAGSEFGRILTSAFNLLNGKTAMAVRNKRSLAYIYGYNLVRRGPDAAASALNAVKADTAHYYLSEWEFNQLGGNLLFGSSFTGHEALALETFKLNTFLFPDSFNTYGSYGDGLKATGKKEEAMQMYQKAITINPHDEDDKAALKNLKGDVH